MVGSISQAAHGLEADEVEMDDDEGGRSATYGDNGADAARRSCPANGVPKEAAAVVSVPVTSSAKGTSVSGCTSPLATRIDVFGEINAPRKDKASVAPSTSCSSKFTPASPAPALFFRTKEFPPNSPTVHTGNG